MILNGQLTACVLHGYSTVTQSTAVFFFLFQVVVVV